MKALDVLMNTKASTKYTTTTARNPRTPSPEREGAGEGLKNRFFPFRKSNVWRDSCSKNKVIRMF